jgi:hypothetical protein
MTPQVTEEQLKSLKLFSVYLQSYGAETATKEYYIEGCDVDWEDEQFQSPQISTSIDTYAKIDEVLSEIVESNNLIEESTTDCDLRGQLTIRIDCNTRTLEAYSMQWEYSSEDSSDSKTLDEISQEYDENTYNEVLRLFKEIGENGECEIKFQGGGDDGSIDEEMEINGSLEIVPKLIYDMVYQWLTDTGIDWYNNDGGQGSFVFTPKHSEIVLNIEQNYEESVDTPMEFVINF